MSLPYRLCAIDLDDTLLNSEHKISDYNVEAINAVKNLGVYVVIASGRMHVTTLNYVRRLGLDTPIISYNGALVKSAASDTVWLSESVPAPLANQILEYANQTKVQLNYYLNEILYTAEYTPWMKLYHDRTQAPIQALPDFYSALRDKSPTKLVIVDSPANIDKMLPVLSERFASQLYVTRSNAEYLELLPINANKGRALKLVADRYKIDAEETVAFGDSWNDLPMIQWAGLGIAVSNAKPELKAVAHRIVGSNDEDGVGHALIDIYSLSPK